MTLQGGDELTLIASTCYSFVYKPSEDQLQLAAADGTPAERGAEPDAATGAHIDDPLRHITQGKLETDLQLQIYGSSVALFWIEQASQRGTC